MWLVSKIENKGKKSECILFRFSRTLGRERDMNSFWDNGSEKTRKKRNTDLLQSRFGLLSLWTTFSPRRVASFNQFSCDLLPSFFVLVYRASVRRALPRSAGSNANRALQVSERISYNQLINGAGKQSPNCCLVSFFVLNLLPTSVYTVLHSSAWRGWLVVERKRMLFPTNCKRTCKIFTIFIITHPSHIPLTSYH